MGPGGIIKGSYDPKNLTQEQRTWLYNQFGHGGEAPVGYGGEGPRVDVDGGSSGGGGSTALSAPDVAKLREQVYNTLQPYYLQLAKEAQGDFDRASKILEEDYVKGVRDQRVEFAFMQKQQLGELTNTLNQLGISNAKDQDQLIEDLNKRGAAVYQNSPDGQYNVVRPSTITSNTNLATPEGQPFDTTSTVTTPVDTANLGRGGFEMARLIEDQRLRQEAQQRAATKPIEAAGIQLKQFTNIPTGIDPNLPPDQLAKALAGADRTKLGTREQELIRGKEQKTRELQITQEDLANQRASEISNITGPLAQAGTKALGSELENRLLKEKQNTFVTSGT